MKVDLDVCSGIDTHWRRLVQLQDAANQGISVRIRANPEATLMLKQTDAVLEAWLVKAIATGGPYDPAAIFAGLGTAYTDRGAQTVLSDITPAGGDLATRQAITPWSAPYREADGRWVVDGPPLHWSPADATEQAVVTVWYIASLATLGVLKAFGPLSPTITLLDDNNRITIVPRITIDPTGRFSAEVVWNG